MGWFAAGDLIYRAGPDLLRWLSPAYYCGCGIYHYRRMVKTSYHGYLRADLMLLKKYFYALRPLRKPTA
jgi:predicted nucleotidyltransferase